MRTILCTLLFATSLYAQPSRTALAHDTFAITHVAVITMTSEKPVTDATVLVREGRIVAVGSKVDIPAGTRTIDGTGKFLMPGLADMHVHLFSDETAPKSKAPDELGVMLANGVTTIRLMIGTPEHLQLRKSIEAGKLLGPQFWVASPQFTGRKDVNAQVVTTPDEAQAAVKLAADNGYDFIKLTLFITPQVFDAIMAEAVRQGIRVIGHVDARVGVARALKAGQHIEHLDNYMESILKDDAPMKESVSDFHVGRLKNWDSLDYVDDAKLKKIAIATAQSRTFTCPTLTLFRKAFAEDQNMEEIRSRPDWGLQPAAHRDLYLRGHERYWKKPPSAERRKRYIEVRNRIVKEIADAGGKIMAGSDAPEWFLGYGYTLHRELESLVLAGLTPYQALAAATTNPAEFLHGQSEWGTISVGKRADLVLLNANPLDDIRNTNKIEGVAIGGKWLAKERLKEMIELGVSK